MQLQFSNGFIDISENQEVNLSSTTFRFNGIRDSFTTDFTIPKTTNNVRILGAYGLLDRTTQFEAPVDALLISNGEYIEVEVEVTKVTDTDITLCCFEKMWTNEFNDVNIRSFLSDSQSTIFEWNKDSRSKYPVYFRKYNYGMNYNSNYAQYHPSVLLNRIIDRINLNSQHHLPFISQNIYTIATNKYVCPINRIQAFETNSTTLEDGVFNLYGGQHITNDMSWSKEKYITFNRRCSFNLRLYVVWDRSNNMYQDHDLILQKNGSNFYYFTFSSGSNPAQYVVFDLNNINVSFGDYISFIMDDPDAYRHISIVGKIEYVGDYEINDDDYSIELEYISRRPHLWGKNSDYSDDFEEFDGGIKTLRERDVYTFRVVTESLSFAYFGLFNNIPDMSVKDFVTMLCWLTGLKPKIMGNSVQLLQPNNTKEISGYVTEKSPISEFFGQNNFIKYENDRELVSTITNRWLEKEKNLVELKLYDPDVEDQYNLICYQYSNPSYDDGDYSVDYEQTGFCLGDGWWSGTLSKVEISNFNLNTISRIMECTIVTKDNVKDCDYVVLDGRTYMVISMDVDIENKLTTVKTILI